MNYVTPEYLDQRLEQSFEHFTQLIVEAMDSHFAVLNETLSASLSKTDAIPAIQERLLTNEFNSNMLQNDAKATRAVVKDHGRRIARLEKTKT